MASAKQRQASKKPTSPKRTATLADDLTRAAVVGKKKLAAALETIRKLRGEGTAAFDELWEQVREVLDAEPPLWRHGEYKNEPDFVRRELPGETLRSVKRNILVASCFNKDRLSWRSQKDESSEVFHTVDCVKRCTHPAGGYFEARQFP